jgi:large subunit ribosomal protein L3
VASYVPALEPNAAEALATPSLPGREGTTDMATRMGLIGKKIGMTQIFVDGERIPVTAVMLGPNVVVQKKTKDSKDGYNAIQLGFDDKAHRKVNKAMTGHFKRHDIKPKWILRELLVEDADIENYEVGKELRADVFKENEYVDVAGTSKGRGMQGVMRRHNMKGSKQYTHGTHEYRRHTGSIGCRTTPGEVHLGKRMPGHMGSERVTIQNLRIAKIDLDKNIVLIRGSVPGPNNGYVMVYQAVKNQGRIHVAQAS